MAYSKANYSLPHFMIYPKRKSAKDMSADIYMRIGFQIYKHEKSLGVKINFRDWDATLHEAKEQPVHNFHIRQKAEEYKQKVMGAYYMLTQHGGEFTLQEIMDTAFQNDGGKLYSLFGVFESMILRMEKGLKPGASSSNIGKHWTCLKHLKDFIRINYKLSDISFSRINRSLIDNFESYLKTEVGNNHNSAMKMLQIFKKVYRIAFDNRWTLNNAFASKKFSFNNVEMPYLTVEEIKLVKDQEIKSERLSLVRDLFIFGCYTGLAYIDLKNLRRCHLEYNPVSQLYFIKKKREKTKQPFIIPLFNPAKNILDKRTEAWEYMSSDTTLLTVMSNQKYNLYLKEIAALCGIQKNLTTHLARHTFATTIALENGVSLESTSKMLGHAKISQTQKYAKVTEMKIAKETSNLYLQLKS
jgi:site-specific recombinase XerD